MDGYVERHCGELQKQMCVENSWTMLSLKAMPKHIHLFLPAGPGILVSRIVQTLRRKLLQPCSGVSRATAHPEMWTLMGASYYA